MTSEEAEAMREKLTEARRILGEVARQTNHKQLFPAIQSAILCCTQSRG